MKRIEIKCIKKIDRNSPVERITHVGGENWKQTLSETIQEIEDDQYEFFVTVNAKEVKVVVAESHAGNKYLKTETDYYKPNNLLSLPECF